VDNGIAPIFRHATLKVGGIFEKGRTLMSIHHNACTACKKKVGKTRIKPVQIFATFPPHHRTQMYCISCLQERGWLCIMHQYPHCVVAPEKKPDGELLFAPKSACPLCAIEEANSVQTDVANALLEELVVTFPEQFPAHEAMYRAFEEISPTKFSKRTNIIATLIIIAVCLGYDSVLTMLEEAQSKLSGAGTA
jgi:hypothetical protein